MGELWFRVNRVADESGETATARKVAAIVATITAGTIMRCALAPGGWSVEKTTRLAGYLYGFSEMICAAWAISDTGIAVDAARFPIKLIFPETLNGIADCAATETRVSRLFDSGSIAGRADGERYVASGRSGTTLLAMLAG